MTIENLLSEILDSTKDKMLGLSPYDLGIKAKFTVVRQQINLDLEAGFPTKLFEKSLLPELQQACEQALKGYQVKLNLKSCIRPHRTQLVGQSLRGVKNTIAIASGKGGVGKSTVAVNLALALARAGARVGLLDADIYGPSIPLMLGKSEPVEVKDERYLPVMAHGIQAMSIGYLTDSGQALIWRGPMLAKSMIQMLDLTLWDDLDYLFIDLPPGTGDIQLSLVQKIPLTGALIVTTPQNVATLDAQKAIKMFEHTNINVLGLIENMSLHHCSQCGHQEAIFGSGGGKQLSDSFNVEMLGQLPLDQQIARDCDQGLPTTAQENNDLAKPFNQAALRMAIALAAKPLNYADKFPGIVVES
ncbi:MAG: iron-sulfur cluster carrier protein ApbC [Tatlockia sp.]|nr:iron-sulfur cluster carrier protein ApbC [Tatlockia sp.]